MALVSVLLERPTWFSHLLRYGAYAGLSGLYLAFLFQHVIVFLCSVYVQCSIQFQSGRRAPVSSLAVKIKVVIRSAWFSLCSSEPLCLLSQVYITGTKQTGDS